MVNNYDSDPEEIYGGFCGGSQESLVFTQFTHEILPQALSYNLGSIDLETDKSSNSTGKILDLQFKKLEKLIGKSQDSSTSSKQNMEQQDSSSSAQPIHNLISDELFPEFITAVGVKRCSVLGEPLRAFVLGYYLFGKKARAMMNENVEMRRMILYASSNEDEDKTSRITLENWLAYNNLSAEDQQNHNFHKPFILLRPEGECFTVALEAVKQIKMSYFQECKAMRKYPPQMEHIRKCVEVIWNPMTWWQKDKYDGLRSFKQKTMDFESVENCEIEFWRP